MKQWTADAIRARCTEVGDCLLWTGNKAGGRRGGEAYARLRHMGRCIYAHRLLDEIANGPLPAGWTLIRLADRCEASTCCNLAHWRRVPIASRQKELAKQGRVPGGAAHAAAVAAARRRNGVNKLTIEAAREIRTSGEHWTALVARYGISRALVYHIRRGERWADLGVFRA